MPFSKILSAQNHLLKAHIISVETDISKGSLHAFSIVGLPDKAIEEARDRVSAAIKNSGYKSPKQTNAKIVVSLAPADIKKEGPAFDLPIALGYLLAVEEIEFDPEKKLFIGELALDGSVRPVDGILSYARLALSQGITELFVPQENATEAALIQGISVYGVSTLTETINHLNTRKEHIEKRVLLEPQQTVDPVSFIQKNEYCADLDDVVGQGAAKRGLIIAASGGHNIALYGPPGTGKTMLARALHSILPPLTFDEMLEITEIHSVAGCLDGSIITSPPVRAPHHTSSYTSLVGGGSVPKPGEITLAHRGILFLDEFPEFDRKVIESLRQPLEDRIVSIARARGTARFPAHFILVAAMNPCPCGNRGIQGKECICAPLDIARYGRKLSGPIIDRIDMWIEVSKIDHDRLMRGRSLTGETDRAKKIVIQSRARQKERCKKLDIDACCNADISSRDMARSSFLSKDAEITINKAAQTYDLSARGYHRTIKLARTIADIEGSEYIKVPHIMEALQYRQRQFKKD